MDLAAEHGVSRPVIRAALARLREAGLIVSRKGAGSFVSAPAVEPDSALGPMGSIGDIADFYDYRRFLEAEAAARAAIRCQPTDILPLTALLDEIDRRIAEGRSTVELDIRFHHALAALADNRFLLETLTMMRAHMRFVGQFVGSLTPARFADHKQHMQVEHRALVRAIAGGKAEAARAAMIRHINGSEQRIFKGTSNAD